MVSAIARDFIVDRACRAQDRLTVTGCQALQEGYGLNSRMPSHDEFQNRLTWRLPIIWTIYRQFQLLAV